MVSFANVKTGRPSATGPPRILRAIEIPLGQFQSPIILDIAMKERMAYPEGTARHGAAGAGGLHWKRLASL